MSTNMNADNKLAEALCNAPDGKFIVLHTSADLDVSVPPLGRFSIDIPAGPSVTHQGKLLHEGTHVFNNGVCRCPHCPPPGDTTHNDDEARAALLTEFLNHPGFNPAIFQTIHEITNRLKHNPFSLIDAINRGDLDDILVKPDFVVDSDLL